MTWKTILHKKTAEKPFYRGFLLRRLILIDLPATMDETGL